MTVVIYSRNTMLIEYQILLISARSTRYNALLSLVRIVRNKSIGSAWVNSLRSFIERPCSQWCSTLPPTKCSLSVSLGANKAKQ